MKRKINNLTTIVRISKFEWQGWNLNDIEANVKLAATSTLLYQSSTI